MQSNVKIGDRTMSKSILKYVRMNYHNAERMVEECIKDLVAPFGHEGLELNNSHCSDEYQVICEITPNNFKRVEYIRCNNDNLEMKLEGSDRWEILAFVDRGFLLDEVANTLELD